MRRLCDKGVRLYLGVRQSESSLYICGRVLYVVKGIRNYPKAMPGNSICCTMTKIFQFIIVLTGSIDEIIKIQYKQLFIS